MVSSDYALDPGAITLEVSLNDQDYTGPDDYTAEAADGTAAVTPRGPFFDYYGAPRLDAFSPTSGPTNGGTVVTLEGAELDGGLQETCRFGNAGYPLDAHAGYTDMPRYSRVGDPMHNISGAGPGYLTSGREIPWSTPPAAPMGAAGSVRDPQDPYAHYARLAYLLGTAQGVDGGAAGTAAAVALAAIAAEADERVRSPPPAVRKTRRGASRRRVRVSARPLRRPPRVRRRAAVQLERRRRALRVRPLAQRVEGGGARLLCAGRPLGLRSLRGSRIKLLGCAPRGHDGGRVGARLERAGLHRAGERVHVVRAAEHHRDLARVGAVGRWHARAAVRRSLRQRLRPLRLAPTSPPPPSARRCRRSTNSCASRRRRRARRCAASSGRSPPPSSRCSS